MKEKNPLESVSQQTFTKRKIFFQSILIIMIFGFGLLTFFAKSHPYFGFDLTITKIIQTINIIWFSEIMRFISLLGTTVIAIGILVAAIILSISVNKKKNAIFLLLSSVGTTLITITFKLYVDRPRPDNTLISLIGSPETSPSFPSGHVLFFMGFYGLILFFVYSQLVNSLFRKVLIAILFLILISVGVSRIYLGVHWFSDVLGSYLIGTVWLYFMIYLYKRIG